MKKNDERRWMRRLVRLLIFSGRSSLFLIVISLSPIWIPIYLVAANFPDYWDSELKRWIPAWCGEAKKAWRGDSQPNAQDH
jgi:hypothetical protein